MQEQLDGPTELPYFFNSFSAMLSLSPHFILFFLILFH